MNKLYSISFVSLLSAAMVMSCKRNSSDKQELFTETYEPVSLSQSSNVAASLDLQIDNKEDIYQKIMSNKFVLKGTYLNCYGIMDNEIWSLDKDAENALMVKKNDSNCKLIITGFMVKNMTSAVIAEYELVSLESAKKAQLEANFSTSVLTFIQKTNNSDFSPELYSYAKISPANFSSNPVISLLLTNTKNKKLDLGKDSDKTTIFIPEFSPTKNVQFISTPEYNVNDEKFTLTSDSESHATFYTGYLSFENISNPAQKYLVVDSSVNLEKYSNVDKIFKENSAKVKTIDQSKNELKISAHELRINGKLPQIFRPGEVKTVKIIFARTITEDNKEFASYFVTTINIRKNN